MEQQFKHLKISYICYMDIFFSNGLVSKSVPFIVESSRAISDEESVKMTIDTCIKQLISLVYKIMYCEKNDAKYYVVNMVIKNGTDLIREEELSRKSNKNRYINGILRETIINY